MIDVSIGLVALIVSLGYWKYRRTYSFWSSRGIRGPTPLPFFGNSHSLFFNSYSDVDQENFKKFGRIYGTYDGSKPILVISDPDLITQIWTTNHSSFQLMFGMTSPDPLDTNNIISTHGEQWKRLRTAFSTALTTSKLKTLFQDVNSSKKSFFNHLEGQIAKGKDIDARQSFSLLTLDIAAKGFFSMDIDVYKAGCQFVEKARVLLDFRTLDIFLMQVLPWWFISRFEIGVKSMSSGEYFKDLIKHLTNERIKSDSTNTGRKDFMQQLLDSKDENAAQNGKGMTEIEVAANGVATIGASFDTTTSALSFLTYRMTTNPKIQDKVYEEVIKVVGNDLSKDLTYEDVMQLQYLEAALYETLRMNPVDFRNFRVATEDTTIPGTEIQIPKGTQVQVASYALQLDPEFFPEPNEFKPERFLPENKHLIKSGSFMSFGAGPRMCFGMRFALMDVKKMFAEIIRRYRIVPSTEMKNGLQLSKGMLMNSDVGIKFKLVPRN